MDGLRYVPRIGQLKDVTLWCISYAVCRRANMVTRPVC